MKKHFNRIRKYLSGEMSAEEAQNLEADLSSSKVLRQELNAQKIERAVIKKEKEQEAYFRSMINEVKRKVDGETK
ncbi:MAG: hypothetical protein AAFP82_05740 [Bacteroidota bacterium]